MEETNKIATLARSLPKYDGRDRSVFPNWKAKLRVHLTLGAPGIFKILQGRECPNPPGNADTVEDSADIIHTIERWKIDNSYFYFILFLATNDGAQKLVEQFEGKSIDDGAGDGRAAWEALASKYNGISNSGRVASYKVLHNSKLQPGQDPDIWLYAMDGARDVLHEHGAQHGDPVKGSPWEGGDTPTPQDHRLHGFRTHRNAHQEAGEQTLGGRALRVQPRHQGVPYVQRKNKQGVGEQERRVHRDAIEASVTTDQRAGQQQRDGQHRHPQFSPCKRGPRHAARRARLHIAYRLQR